MFNSIFGYDNHKRQQLIVNLGSILFPYLMEVTAVKKNRVLQWNLIWMWFLNNYLVLIDGGYMDDKSSNISRLIGIPNQFDEQKLDLNIILQLII